MMSPGKLRRKMRAGHRTYTRLQAQAIQAHADVLSRQMRERQEAQRALQQRSRT